MKHYYLNLKGKLLLAMFIGLGSVFSVSAIERTLKFSDAAGQPVSHYTFTFTPGEIRATTDSNGTCTVNFPYEGPYEIIPEYWERPLWRIEVIPDDASEIPVQCSGGVATFSLKGISPSEYTYVDPIICNGSIIHPRWDASGKWRYLSDNSCIDYNMNVPLGSLSGYTCDFNNDIELLFDLQGKQRVTITVTDEKGAPLKGAYVSVKTSEFTSESTRTDADGIALQYLPSGSHRIEVNKLDYESALFYETLQQEIAVADSPAAVSISYQGNAAPLNITAKGYQNVPLQDATISLERNGNRDYAIRTNQQGQARILFTGTGPLRYQVTCYMYVKEVSGTLDIADLSDTYFLLADFSDCYKTTVSLTDCPDVFRLYGNMTITSEQQKEMAQSSFEYYPKNPEINPEPPCFYMAPGSYNVLINYIQAETGSPDNERFTIYPLEKPIQIQGEQQILVSLGGLHRVRFLLSDERFHLDGMNFYKGGKPYFYTSDEMKMLYMPDGEYEWSPQLSSQAETDYRMDVITGAPQKFTVNGNDRDVIWEMNNYHKATFSFDGTADGNTQGYIDFSLMHNGNNLYNASREISPEKSINFYLPDGEYFYEVEMESVWGNEQDQRDDYYGLPRQTGTIAVNGNDIQQVISYREYIPLEVEVKCNDVLLPFYFIEIADMNGKTILIDDIEGRYKIYLLPGEYRFTATAPLYTTVRETQTISNSMSTNKITLNVNEGGGYAVALYFYDSESDKNLAGVQVQFGNYDTQYTNEEGTCIYFDIPDGSLLALKATKEGYRPIEQSLLIAMSQEELEEEESVFYREFEMEKINDALESPLSQDSGICLYPNPASESFTVRLPETETDEWHLVLADMSGKQLLSTILRSGISDPIDITYLPKGIYIVKVYNRTETRQEKLIKK